MAENEQSRDPNAFRFRIRTAPGGSYASVDAFKASPSYATVQTIVEGKPDTVGTVYVSYKLYEGDVWCRYDFANEASRLEFAQYVIDAGYDLGQKPIDVGAGSLADFPSYGFLA